MDALEYPELSNQILWELVYLLNPLTRHYLVVSFVLKGLRNAHWELEYRELLTRLCELARCYLVWVTILDEEGSRLLYSFWALLELAV